MLYGYGCHNCGSYRDEQRSIDERDRPTTCVACGGLMQRDVAVQLRSITINPVPLNFYTQWSDVYTESPREMAKRKNIERYDPSLPNKPKPTPVRLNVPRGIEDVDTLVKAIAPVDGKSETSKMLERVAPVESERAYT